ncbi:MAG: YggT family protein [Alphaproteobacteria bacterium]
MIDLLYFISRMLGLYIYVILASAIFSWLYAFNVVNTRNQFISMIGQFLHTVTEPVLRPIRRILPATAGIDLSPLVLILGIWFIQVVIIPNLADLFR